VALRPSIKADIVWTKVDLLTPYQRLTAEMQVRGRLRETINDPESVFHLHNIVAEPLLPGAAPLAGIPDGLFNKAYVGGIRMIEPEPPPPDQVMEMMRRYCLYQGNTFTVSGSAEFPKAADPNLHTDMLLKGRFFELFDATVTIIGAPDKAWTQPVIWVNRDLMISLFLG
jgi:hypothetical protein